MPSEPTLSCSRVVAARAVAIAAVAVVSVALVACTSNDTDDQVAQSGNTTITTSTGDDGGSTTSTLPTQPACDEATIRDAFDASGQSPSTGVSNLRCVDTWAVADITTAAGGSTDATNLFQANGLVWVAMGDVVPPDAATLHALGVPTDVADELIGGGNG
jgi:hypothetical protein